jgi:hypothetical protein
MVKRSSQPTALVASARRVHLGRTDQAEARQTKANEQWQREAGVAFDEVEEVKAGVWFTGNSMAKLRLFPAVLPDDDPEAEPIPVDAEGSGITPDVAAAAWAELRRLNSTYGGLPELQRAWNMNTELTGELWLVGWGARNSDGTPYEGDDPAEADKPEWWEVRSVLEVQPKEDGGRRTYEVASPPHGHSKMLDLSGKLGDGTDHEGQDTIIRVWQRHPLRAEAADSHLRAALVDCKALRYLTNQVLVEAMSAMPADLLLIPNELTVATPTPPASPPTEGSAAPPTGDPFANALDDAFTESIEDPTALSAVRHMVIRGPAEFLKADYFRTVSLARDRSTELEARITARVERLARGMNLPVEKIMGHQSTTFANAEQVDQDTFEDYLQARAEGMCDGLTGAYLRPNMTDADHDAAQVQRIMVWYDPAELVGQPDTERNADGAHDRNTISDAAYRRAKGFSEDDAPEPLDLLIKAGLRRGILTADLTRALLELLGQPIDVEPLPAAPPADVPPDEAGRWMAAAARAREAEVERVRMERFVSGLELMERSVGAAQTRATAGDAFGVPGVIDTTGAEAEAEQLARAASSVRAGTNPGARLLAIDQDVRTRLQVAADDHLTRALETAGNRLRSRTKGSTRELARGVSRPNQVAATLGRALVAQAGITDDELLDGAFDALEQQFRTWGSGAQRDALELVNSLVGGFSTSERDALQLRQAADLDEAWGWMHEALQSLARARLYDPTGAGDAADALGEQVAAGRVPPGLVRQAVAEAGGAAGITTVEGNGAYITLQNGGSRPAGGIGTGELLVEAMRDHDVQLEAYRWVYGPARRQRPFEPHQSLDGAVFRNFDDPVLSNDSGWPEFAYYLPGDHSGCMCDVEPVIVTPDELSS